MCFYETNHGQSEGDAMHRIIAIAVKRAGNAFTPTQLAMIIRLARKVPYKVTEVQPSMIKDWKQIYSQQIRILRIRESDEGAIVDWTKVMQLHTDKSKKQLFNKTSHCHGSFLTLSLNDARRNSTVTPPDKPGLVIQLPKLSNSKYNDLLSLCNGPISVISNQDHVSFYENLPHWQKLCECPKSSFKLLSI